MALKSEENSLAMRRFFKMPLFFIDPAFYSIEKLFSFFLLFSEYFFRLQSSTKNFSKKKLHRKGNFWLMLAWVALTLIGRKFLETRRKIEAKRCENSLRGWKVEEEKRKKTFHIMSDEKSGEKFIALSVPPYCSPIRRVVPCVAWCKFNQFSDLSNFVARISFV